MHTRFLFVRHATCARTDDVLFGRAVDAPLDVRGRRQARLLAARLRDERPLRLLTSPRLRARQTAQAIATAVGVAPRISAALDEIDYGDWSGRRFADLAADPRWRRWNAERERACTPAGATIAGTQARVLGLLGALSRRFRGATLVLVTHAEIVRSALLHTLDAPAGDYRLIDVAPASLTVLHGHEGRLFADAADLRMRA
jgi:broad specificity phosphatase PhoE